MPVPSDIHDAVVALCEPTLDPALTDPEIDAAIVRRMRWSFWSSSVVYTLGALAAPVTANGWVYAVATAGTSGASEPAWTVPRGGYTNPYARVSDNGVVWMAAFPDLGGPYDVKAAAAECWRAKARKVAADMSFADGQRKFDAAGVYEKLIAEANRMEPARFF